jgi:hypothetical protein
MPKFKILVTVVAIWCSPPQLATANTIVLSYDFDSPTNNPGLNTGVARQLGSGNEPTPALAPTPNALLIMLRRWFGY